MKVSFLIIDGYNVLHTCGLLPRHVGKGALEKSRQRLLALLRQRLTADQQRRTTIVFDARLSATPELASHEGILVEFAVDHPTADARIIQLIRQHSAPRQLTVVSSDHEIQRVANVRRCLSIDSDVWFDQLLFRNEPVARSGHGRESDKPDADFRARNVAYWMARMGLTGGLPDEGPVPETSRQSTGVESVSDPAPAIGKDDPEDGLFPPEMLDELNKLLDDNQDAP
jgi:predicted RNA-binding protein with PIN domain